jgi:hypothetical protein
MLLAILLPFTSFLFRGKIFPALICLLLQMTLFGWPIAVFWAIWAKNNAMADKRADRIVNAIAKK